MGVYIRANSCEQLDREIRVAVNTVKYLLFFLMGCFLFSRRDALSRGDRRDERNGETTFSRKIRILRLVLRFRRRIQFFFPYIYRIYIYRYYFEIISKRLFRQDYFDNGVDDTRRLRLLDLIKDFILYRETH